MDPVLVTSRLSLRRITAGDAAHILELMNEPAYIENIGDRGVRTVSDAALYIEEKYNVNYERYGYGLCLVELREGSVPIGICGLVRRLSLDHPDVGFAYLQRFWSKGYASEAAEGVLALARDTLALPYLYGVVSPRNERSIRILERLGLRYLRPLQMPGSSTEGHVYGMELGPVPPAGAKS